MAAPNLFQQWLTGSGSYAAGVALYAQHGPSAVLKRMFALGPTPFNQKKLREALEALASAPAPTMRRGPSATPPPEYRALIDERIRSFREAQHLQARLELLPNDAERLAAAIRIRDIFDRNEAIWTAIQHYELHGHLPAPTPTVDPAAIPPLPNTISGLVKRRNTLRTYISSKRGDADKEALWRAEMAQIEDALREDENDVDNA